MPAYLIWFLIGVAFLLAELALPGFIVIFFCIGSWVAALLSWLTDMAVQYQVLVFLVSSLLSLFTLRRLFLRTFGGQAKGDPDQEMRETRIGKTGEVTKAIGPHSPGEIKCLGSFWRAVADEDIGEGESVIILEVASEDGLTYKVQPVARKGAENG